MRQRHATLALALFALTAAAGAQTLAASSDAPQASRQLEHEDLYTAALRALADGQADAATRLLSRFLAEEPQHAGAWLDLALSQCSLGNSAEAERLFTVIQERFNPAPGILEVIARLRAAGCRPPPPRPPYWLLSVGRGYDSNVNQGASSGIVTIGSGATLSQLVLTPDYLPQTDNYAAANLDYLRPLDNHGTLAILQARARWNDSLHQQDTANVVAGLERLWYLGSWRIRATAATSWLTLDRGMYQHQNQLMVRVMPPVRVGKNGELALVSTVSRAEYRTRPQYDNSAWELGGTYSYQRGATQAQWMAGAQGDRGREERPGGDRHGWYAAGQWYHQFNDKAQGEFSLAYQHWLGRAIYSPGLLDVVRSQNTNTARAAIVYAIAPRQSLVFEYRQVINRENIGLFQYNSRAFQVSWRWNNF